MREGRGKKSDALQVSSMSTNFLSHRLSARGPFVRQRERSHLCSARFRKVQTDFTAGAALLQGQVTVAQNDALWREFSRELARIRPRFAENGRDAFTRCSKVKYKFPGRRITFARSGAAGAGHGQAQIAGAALSQSQAHTFWQAQRLRQFSLPGGPSNAQKDALGM